MQLRQVDEVSEFSLRYAGPSVDDGNMDVLDLAPALLAVGRLCTKANSVLNGQRASVSVQVHAQPRIGSFLVDLHLVQSAATQGFHAAQTLVENEGVKTGKEILDTIGAYGSPLVGGVHTLIEFVKILRNRQIKGVDKPKAGDVTLTIGDGDRIDGDVSITVNQNVYNLYQMPGTKDDLARLVQPLESEGIQELDFVVNDQVAERITQGEASFFQDADQLTKSSEFSSENESVRLWRVRSISTDPSLQWHFLEGEKTKVGAYIHDERFMRDLARRQIPVFPGDILRVRVRTETTLSNGKLTVKHDVQEVMTVIRQMQFSFENDEEIEDG